MAYRIRSSARGFSLLEVLIAVVILSVGLLALASLQVSLIRSSSDTRAESTAVALAKERIEDMRSFASIEDYSALDGGVETAVAIGGVSYIRTTTVTRFLLDTALSPDGYSIATVDATESALSADVSHDYVLGRDFKRVSVEVKWVDATAATRKVTIEDVIDGLDPAASGKIAKNSGGISARKAEILVYDPSLTPGVIPIAIDPSSDESTAATNPRPIVNDGGNETRFDVYTYVGLAGDDALAQARVETTLIGCTCDSAEADDTQSAYRPTYWVGNHYVAPTLASYAPLAGRADLGNGGNAISESPYCDVCCRDHHDPSSIASNKPKFDPRRSAHEHYYEDDDGALVLTGSNGITEYMEACRLIRVDGIYRVAADMNNEYFNLLAAKNDGSATEYAPSTVGVASYQALVLEYLDTKVVANTDAATYNTAVTGTPLSTMELGNAINNDPVTLQRVADHEWLHSRGLYIDYLEQDALDAIYNAKQGCDNTNCTDAELSVAVLSVLPFTSINVTELSNWLPSVADASEISVTDGSFYDAAAAATAPIRGYVTPAGTIANGQAFSINATSKMLDSNSGLVARATAIDSDETFTPNDSQQFDLPAGGSGSGGGNFTVAFTGYGFAVLPQLSGTSVNTCTSQKVGNGSNATYQYTCSASPLPTAPMTLTVSNYNYTAAAATGLDVICTGANGDVNYTTTKQDAPLVTCKNFELTTASTSAVGESATPGGPIGVGLAETTSTLITSVNASNTITLNFTGPITTFAGYTCSYLVSGNKTNYTVTSTNATCP